MGRMLGTVSMGIRAPIIRQGDNLVDIVTESILAAMKEARENRDLETLDADNLESVIASL